MAFCESSAPTRLARTTLCALLLLACSDSHGGQTGDEDALPPASGDFYTDLARGMGSADYQPAPSVAALIEDSELVAVGTPVALRPGRSFVLGEGDTETRLGTRVLEVEVEQTLVGPELDALYLEFHVGASDGGIGADASAPSERVLVFARPAQEGSIFLDGAIENPGAGLPAGEPLYALTTPQAFVLASADGASFSQPFEPTDGIFGDGDFESAVQRAAAAAMADPTAGSDAGAGTEVDGGTSPGVDAGTAGTGCPGEAESCPPGCFEMTAFAIDDTLQCIDYSDPVVVGCTPDEGGTDDAPCVQRVSDGARFIATQGSPFRGSDAWQDCDSQPDTFVDCADGA